MKFFTVALVFEAIEAVSSRLKKIELLANLLQQLTPNEAKILAYLIQSQLFPIYKNINFNISHSRLIFIIAKFCNKEVVEIEAAYTELGDLGNVIQRFCTKKDSALSIVAVYEKLIALVNLVGNNSIEFKVEYFVALFNELDVLSIKYIIRIIDRKLRLGFSELTFLSALAQAEFGNLKHKKELEKAYNYCSDLGLISEILKRDGLDAIKDYKIKLGIPLRVALAESMKSAVEIFEKIGPEIIVQHKLDGFRVQVHLEKNNSSVQVYFFSRNLFDISFMFPDLINSCNNLNVASLICEGEAIIFDTTNNCFLPFQQTVKRKRKHGIAAMVDEYPLSLYLFDILYLNGESLLNKSCMERRLILEKIIIDTSDNLKLIEQQIVKSGFELENYYNSALDSQLEGIICKKINSKYEPGKRNFNWIKFKKQSFSKLSDSIDCVILGYYFGAGKRTAFGIGAFLVGIYNQSKNCFQTIAKIGTGMTDLEWQDLKLRADGLKIITAPQNVQISKQSIPDVWILPELVCSIAADEITVSTTHTACFDEKTATGYALRFPRFLGYRFDKSIYDITSCKDLKNLLIHSVKD